jgi:hypothetical protein
MYPDEYLKKLWHGISYQVKITFLSSMVMGLIVHLFMITNMLPNHDTVYVISNARWLVFLGRWFSFVPGFLSSDYILPWISGLLSIFYIAISSCLVIKCLRINNTFHCLLISGLMVSFPTVICTLLYAGDTILSSLLLASLAVYITLQFRYGFCVGFIFTALSLGCYQAYFSVAAALSVGVLIVDVIQMNLPFKEIIIKGVKLFLTLLLGIIAYFVMVKITLPVEAGLTEYMNIHEMGKVPVSLLPYLFKKAYTSIYWFYIRDSYGLHNSFIRYAFFTITAVYAIILTVLIIHKRLFERKGHFFFLILLIVLYPLGCNIVYLMNAKTVYLNMVYGMVFLPVAVIVLMEIIQNSVNHKENQFIFIFKRLACWMASIFFCILIHNYGILANKTYIKAHFVYEQGYAYSVELATRIESYDGYTKDIPILFVGSRGKTINMIPGFDELSKFTSSINNIPSYYSYVTFMQNFLGFRHGIKLCDSSDIAQYNLEQTLESMPLYPENGSIKKINDVLVVKFSTDY